MSERTDKGATTCAVDFVTIKQREIISMQLQKSICKIKGKLPGTGFFCYINYENKNIPCLMTNYHVLDYKFIKDNNKIEIIINDNKIKEDIIINIEDIIYKSKKNEYDLIIIKLKEGKEYMKNINYLELDNNLFNKKSLKGYESIYILHYPNAQNASVSYGKDIIYDPNYKYDIQYKCDTLFDSSGGPILNLLTNKIIGIHKGCIQKNDGIKYNIGTFLKYPLKEINNNNNLYNNYNIELKNPIHILNYHTKSVTCLTLMNDGRLVSCSGDGSIIIYNKETLKPDLIIKEHRKYVKYITQLSSGILASCSEDNSIKLFKIKKNKYEVLQTLNDHKDWVKKIIELKNKTLISCSYDNSIIFYIKDNLEYKKDYHISTNGRCLNVIQTKDNEICYSEDDTICFYDLLERKVKSSISNISCWNMIKTTKDLLIITGFNEISIINVNNYKLRIIKVPGTGCISGRCILNQNMLLIGDESNIIRQWRIEGDNLILISKKEKAHDSVILGLLDLGNGHIASCSGDKTIKIW
jgi:WD40 repeat protein